MEEELEQLAKEGAMTRYMAIIMMAAVILTSGALSWLMASFSIEAVKESSNPLLRYGGGHSASKSFFNLLSAHFVVSCGSLAYTNTLTLNVMGQVHESGCHRGCVTLLPRGHHCHSLPSANDGVAAAGFGSGSTTAIPAADIVAL